MTAQPSSFDAGPSSALAREAGPSSALAREDRSGIALDGPAASDSTSRGPGIAPSGLDETVLSSTSHSPDQASRPTIGGSARPMASPHRSSDPMDQHELGVGDGLRPWERSAAAAAEFASFTWPLTTVAEVQRLLETTHLSPTWLLLGEFSGVWASEVERTRDVVTLAVDRRPPATVCIAYRGEFHDVIHLRRWTFICAWPSCTHVARSNGSALRAKEMDGRTFWGLVGILYVLFAGEAGSRVVEQPLNVLSSYFPYVREKFVTTDFGDALRKTICLYYVNAVVRDTSPYLRAPVAEAQRRPHWEFASAEERDEHRSSWIHFPLFVAALALCLQAAQGPRVPSFGESVETLAVAWHRAGLPVPAGYDSADGLPPTPEGRAYQCVHGPGDQRRFVPVIPHSLRLARADGSVEPIGGGTLMVANPAGWIDGGTPTIEEPPEGAEGREARARALLAAQLVALATLTSQGVMLFFVTSLLQPLVFAPLSGLHVLGAELPLGMPPAHAALPLVERWAAIAWGAAAPATTFMIGQYLNGPRVGVALLPFAPRDDVVIRSPSERRRALKCNLPSCAWFTFAALAGCAIADPVARVFASVSAFARPVPNLADSLASDGEMPVFSFGAMRAASLVSTPRLLLSRTRTDVLLARDHQWGALLRTEILSRHAAGATYLEGWAERIRPPPIDLQDGLADILPDFSDPSLLDYPFTPAYVPPRTTWLPRAPSQRSQPTPFCVTSPVEMLTGAGKRRLHNWLSKIFDQLDCIEREQPNCELLRPHPLALGQAVLRPWARGLVWDFTFERAPCAVPLDFALPIESNLNLPYLRRRLEGYDDQRLLSYLLEGVRFEADVELQTVLVPHLISLPKGFESVRKELYRLEGYGWYRFFNHIPFWPIYLNGQGAAARKLELRFRRTTECGGPRKATFDETGLLAWSLNNASARQHLPQWYLRRLHDTEDTADSRGAFASWLNAKGLLNMEEPDGVSDWPEERKPTLTHVMRDLSILLAASRLLDEPIYVFGDDARDYFNQLAISSEDWWKLGVVFIRAEERAIRAGESEHAGRLFFISERRLGFGAKPSSNIAQRFSEALLFMLRQDMDAADAQHPVDTRPSADEWRARRLRVCRALHPGAAGDDARCVALRRLWFVHMYTDDPLAGVVGVETALRLLKCWKELTLEVGLLMAIEEKRNLGTWAPWLGVLLCAGLGLVIVPKAKLLRTSARIIAVLTERCEFHEYRSLVGMLEFLRCVNCALASAMYGLYAPHGSERIQRGGPSTLIRVTPFMAAQLRRWLQLISETGGAPVTVALDESRRVAPLGVVHVISSDAATDSVPPGLGGFCHGLFWHLPLRPEWLEWLHITALELLATGGSAMRFRAHVTAALRVQLQSDSLATAFVLSRHKAKSDTLQLAHHELLGDADFTAVAEKADISHLGGDKNVFSDSISRSEWPRFYALCRAISVRPVDLGPPPRLVPMIEKLVELARLRGRPIRTASYTRPAPVLPPALLALGRRSPACEEADAVELSKRMRERMQASEAAPPPPAKRSCDASQLSARLRARLVAAPSVADAGPARTSARAPTPVSGAATDATAARGVRRAQGSRGPTLSERRLPGVGRLPGLSTDALRDSALRAAAQRCAAARATDFAAAGFASNQSVEQLTRLLNHAADLNDFGTSHGTRAKDETAWAHWESFATLLGFDPVLSAQQVREHPSHIGTLLATFMLHIYPKMKGKHGRQWAKPRSAFAYVLAIIRIFRGWKLVLPPAKVVKGELHGLLRAYVNLYGPMALMPQRREPMKFEMIKRMLTVDNVRLGCRTYDASSALGFALRGMLALGWRTGHRLAEFVEHPSGELCYLTRGSLSFIIAGVPVPDPTTAQLNAMQPGDVILVQPPRSKTDQFGEIHCPFPSAVPFTSNPLSAGWILREIELLRPCRGGARATQPLFADEADRPFTHHVMDTLLHALLVHCFGAAVSSCYSWHSLRSGLATALKAAKVDDDIIQMICRWTNPESLRAYARHGQALHINCVDQAEKVVIDAVQSANVPKVCNSEGYAGIYREYGGTISARARAVLDAADDAEAATGVAAPADAPDTSPLAASTCCGRRVLVPRAVYPTYACDENNGRGWTARIVQCSRGVASVHFLHAVTARGIPYEDVRLTLQTLEPF